MRPAGRITLSLTTKLLFISALVLIIAVVALLIPVRVQMRQQVIEDLQKELGAVAGTAALQLDGEAIKSVRDMRDIDSPQFQRLRTTLARIRDANHLPPEHIYTFYREGERVRFGVMTHARPFVGDPYDMQPAMRTVFDRGVPQVTDLYNDNNGSWISAYAPIFDSSGKVSAILEVDRAADDYFRHYRWITILYVIMGLASLAISSVIGWFVLHRLVIRPMRAVLSGMDALGRQDFRHRVQLKTRDEFQLLGETLNHLSEELNAARVVQASFTPRHLPDHDGYRLAAFTEPCEATAGDYVDAFALDEKRIAVLVADVTGHGLGPSLLMSACRSALRALSMTNLAPGELIARLDSLLRSDLEGGRFITMIFGILEADGTFTYTNAGHGPAMLATPAGVRALEAHRPPLGVPFDIPFEPQQTTIKLDHGDRLFLATDGVNEAMDGNGAQFGNDRIAAILADRSLSCEEVLKAHRVALYKHCGGRSKTDDVTILCVDRIAVRAAAFDRAEAI